MLIIHLANLSNLRALYTISIFPAIFKRDNFCDFLKGYSYYIFFTKTELGPRRLRAELHAGIFSTLPLTIVKGVSSKTEDTVYPNCGILYDKCVRQMGSFINPMNKLLCIKSRFGCYK